MTLKSENELFTKPSKLNIDEFNNIQSSILNYSFLQDRLLDLVPKMPACLFHISDHFITGLQLNY